MRKRTLLGLALTSALALGSFAVAAQAGPGGPHAGWHHGHGGAFALNKLNLTDAQKASVKQIIQSNFAQNKAQRQALSQQRQAFEALTPTSSGYQAAAAALAQAEGAATTARVQQQANVRAQIYAVLTSAQQSQLATIKAQQQARKQEWQEFKASHPVSSTSQSTQ